MHIHSDQLLQVEHGPSRTTAGSPAPTTLPPSPSSTTPPLTPLTSNPPPSAPAKSEALQELDPVAPTERPQEAMEPVAPTVHPMTSSSAPPQRSFESRHDTVAGYDAMIKYLAAYDADHDGSDALYLFFVCSDENHQPYDWNEQCGPARTAVYDVFAKAPESNHLLTIYAGTAEYWQAANDFRSDRDVRVKMLPCLMKWEGHDGETSGMMVGVSLMEPQFLRYLLKSTDEPDPNLSAVALETKQHRVVAGRPAFDELMEQYRRGDMDENDVLPPLYVMFVSGRMEGNKRPWCPYCRYTEVPVDYAFYAFAPLGAHFVRVEVNPSYKAWKQPNEFNRDPALNLRGVPGFYIVKRVANADQQNELVYERLYQRFDMMNELRILFETTTAPQA
ncbi:TPA: hypothetical protein N0F65_001406 [Lagenidium giganteum]|uniref:Thioredoxin domain-containing protein n=1 Tax=Lagenidium giganteum TaxID=4803 RepID=A0AAV2Z2F6_9STRA|nr:TPA: hypothetical protein N0F65_001406 [Lagenidium giganteum]